MTHVRRYLLVAWLFLASLVSSTAFAIAPLRSWTISPNNAISNSLTHTQQFQTIFYQHKALLVAAGGTIERSQGERASTAWAITGGNTLTVTIGSGHGLLAGYSCVFDTLTAGGDMATPTAISTANATTIVFSWTAANASATEAGVLKCAGAADLIRSAPEVSTGLAGVGSWFVVSFANLGGGTVRFLLNVNDNAAPIQAVQHRGGNATWTGATADSLPTVGTGFAYTTVAIATYHPFSDLRNLRWSSWRTTAVSGAQSIRFVLKEESVAFVQMIFDLSGNSDASGGGVGSERWALYFHSAAASDVLTRTLLVANSNWRALAAGGASTIQPQAASALWELSTLWTAGLDTAGRQNNQTPLIGQDNTGGRLIGAWIDVSAIPTLAGFGLWADSSESAQSQRRKNFGDVAFYWPAGIDIQ